MKTAHSSLIVLAGLLALYLGSYGYFRKASGITWFPIIDPFAIPASHEPGLHYAPMLPIKMSQTMKQLLLVYQPCLWMEGWVRTKLAAVAPSSRSRPFLGFAHD